MPLSFFSSNQVENVNVVQPAAQMPNVFVVPPEEDQTPPWCFFDAENPSFSRVVERPQTPEIAVLLPYNDDTPIPRRNPHPLDSVVPALKGLDTISVVQALMHDAADEDDYDSEFEQNMGFDDPPHAIQGSRRREFAATLRDVANDSDVIEVIKLSRRDLPPEDPEEIESIQTVSERKRNKNLKYRASKIFRSLRSTLRSSKPRAQDAFKSRPSSISSSQSKERSLQDTHSHPRSPTMSRRGSLVLSQLFTSPSSSLKTRNSKTSFDEPISPPMETRPLSPQMSRPSSLYATTAQDEARLQSASPTPTTTSTKFGSRRFSIMNLQRLFSFSSSQADASVLFDAHRATPTPRSNASISPSATSSVTTSGPQTPTSSEGIPSAHILSTEDASELPVFMNFESAFDANAGLGLGLGLGLDLDSSSSGIATHRKKFPSSSSWGFPSPKASNKVKTPQSTHDEDGETSLEMRLDSFHFDDLSFDADHFRAK